MKNEGLITIVIPTYNRAHLIGETIQSVIDQTYPHWELIVVDDGSTDDTESVVKTFKDDRISYHQMTGHWGKLGRIRNHGMRMANGEFIAFLDSDDLWRKDKLEYQLNLLKQYPEAGFTFSNGNRFGKGSVQPPDYANLFVGSVFRPILFEGKFCIYMPSIVFRKKLIGKVGLMNEDSHGGADVDFFYSLSYHVNGIFSNERLVNIRAHEQSTSKRFGDLTYTELIDSYRKFFTRQWITEKEFQQLASKIFYTMALDQLKRGDRDNARKNFRAHNRLTQFPLKGWIRLLQSSF